MTRLAGCSADKVAETFGVHRDAIYRHMENHVDAAHKAALIADVPLEELVKRANDESASLIDYLAVTRRVLTQQMLTAASINDGGTTANVSAKLLDVLREIGRFTGGIRALGSSVTINNIAGNAVFTSSPAFERLTIMLLDRLRAWPEALEAVIEGLDALERSEGVAPAPKTIEGTFERAA